MLSALLAALVLPLSGATQINLQVESGGVHLIAAAGIRTVAIRTGGNAPPRAEVSRTGKSTIAIAITGHQPVHLPFVQGTAAPVDYEVVYPVNVRVEVYDLTGDITIDDSRSPVKIETNSGTITANNAHGPLDLADDSGSITAALAPDWKGDSIRMQSGGGNVRLTVPRNFRAHVDASTGQGNVTDSLPRKNTNAKRPFVWLYTTKGDVILTSSSS
jgi:DUF4097 and DUF4098 domain-containing protein YvlB